MMRMIALVIVALLLAVSAWAAPSPERWTRNSCPVGACSGLWKVTFENGVVETCDIDPGGAAIEKEPHRSAKGQAERQVRSIVIRFDDDRVERWTPVNGKVEVEHWFPALHYPQGQRVRGIAERMQ